MTTLEGQLRRVYAQYLRQTSNLRKWVYLANLRDRNEVLFYRLLTEHISEMLPVVYTPTVGVAIERFSHEFRRPRGVYLSVDHPEDVETAFRNTGLGPDDVDLLVATDSEGILGIGDQGVGGIEIAIGKLAVYTAAAGIHPRRVLPVVLDMGTDNLTLLNDDMYLGARHARVRDQRYDDLIDAYVTRGHQAVPERDAALGGLRCHQRPAHPEQVRRPGLHVQRRHAGHRGGRAGRRVLRGPRRRVPAARPAGRHPRRRHRRARHRGHDARPDDPRGAVAAGGHRRFYATGQHGSADRRLPRTCCDFQVPYARPGAEVAGWARGDGRRRSAWPRSSPRCSPTILIGTSTHAGAFTEAIVKEMAAHTERPIIMPLSNPTSKCEALPAGPDRVDRRPGADRHRQPVRAGRATATGPTRSRRPTTR